MFKAVRKNELKTSKMTDREKSVFNRSLMKTNRSKMTNRSNRSNRSLNIMQPDGFTNDLPFNLFDDIKPDDIKQGACGNCYFLACLSAVAEYPCRIRNIFHNKELNPAGCYAIKLMIDGIPRTIVVDDRFPYDSHKEEWAFSKSYQNEIWVQLLEKAWAKIFGSY